MASASHPAPSLIARARWLDERELPMKPVCGDLATAAYLALGVNPLPTSGLPTKSSGLSGARASAPGSARASRAAPSPTPHTTERRSSSGGGTARVRRVVGSPRRTRPPYPPCICRQPTATFESSGARTARRPSAWWDRVSTPFRRGSGRTLRPARRALPRRRGRRAPATATPMRASGGSRSPRADPAPSAHRWPGSGRSPATLP